MRAIVMLGLVTPLLAAAQCEDCDNDPVGGTDAPAGVVNHGFTTPTTVAKANQRVQGAWTEIGDADWRCLGTPTADQPSTQAIALTGEVDDFQTGNPVGNATVTAFPGIQVTGNLGTATTSDVAATRGQLSMTLAMLPAGQTRVGFRVDADAMVRTYFLGRYLEPASATATIVLAPWSEGSASALPAFIGVTRDFIDGMVTGTMRDCAGHEVSHVIATVSTVSGAPTHAADAETYYFSAASTSLPVRRNIAAATRGDGMFMVMGLHPQTTPAFIQVWGFVTAADLAAGQLTLLAEQPAPLESNAITDAQLEPRRGP